MATGDQLYHNKFLAELAKKNIGLDSDVFRCYLISGAVPNIDTAHFWSDISANEISLTGYSVATLTSLLVTENDVNDRAEWDFANPVWASIAAGTITYAVIVLWTGSAATSIVVCSIETDDANGQSYTLTIGATGIVHIRQATP